MARKRLCPDGWTVTPFRARNSATSRNNNHMFKVENYPNSGSNLERFSTSGDTARHPVLAAIRHNSGDQREGLGALQNVPSSALCALCRAVRDAVQRLPIGLLSHRKPNLGFIRGDNFAVSHGGLKRRVIALGLVRVCQRKFAHSHVKLVA